MIRSRLGVLHCHFPQANMAISLTWCVWIIITRTSRVVSLSSFSPCPNIIICWKNTHIFKTQLSRHCFSHFLTGHLLTAWHTLIKLAFVSFHNETLSILSKWIFLLPVHISCFRQSRRFIQNKQTKTPSYGFPHSKFLPVSSFSLHCPRPFWVMSLTLTWLSSNFLALICY